MRAKLTKEERRAKRWAKLDRALELVIETRQAQEAGDHEAARRLNREAMDLLGFDLETFTYKGRDEDGRFTTGRKVIGPS